MKKSLLAMTALAAMLFAGCTSSDEITTLETIKQAENAPTPVSFGTYMGKTGTRTTNGQTGGITTAQKLAYPDGSTPVGFGVFAYYTNAADYTNTWNSGSQKPNFMYNQQVTGTNLAIPVWSYTPIKYWPNDTSNGVVDGNDAYGTVANGGKISFFAYAPYVASGTGDDGIIGLTANDYGYDPQITYKLPATPLESNTVDLLWGVRGTASYAQAIGGTNNGTVGTDYNKNLTKQTKDETIDFLFKHALAKFGGSATTPGGKGGVYVALDIDEVRTTSTDGNDANNTWDNKTLVTIESITIENGVSGAPSTSTLFQQGIFDIATGTWNTLTTPFTFANTDSYNDATCYLNSNIAEPTSGLTYDNASDNRWEVGTTAFPGVTTNLQQIFNGKDALYFIPNTGNPQSIKVTMTYRVRTYDGLVEGGFTNIEQTISKTINFPSGFESNKQYRLNIYLGLTTVKFTAQVAAWGDPDGTTEDEVLNYIDLPINVN